MEALNAVYDQVSREEAAPSSDRRGPFVARRQAASACQPIGASCPNQLATQAMCTSFQSAAQAAEEKEDGGGAGGPGMIVIAAVAVGVVLLLAACAVLSRRKSNSKRALANATAGGVAVSPPSTHKSYASVAEARGEYGTVTLTALSDASGNYVPAPAANGVVLEEVSGEYSSIGGTLQPAGGTYTAVRPAGSAGTTGSEYRPIDGGSEYRAIDGGSEYRAIDGGSSTGSIYRPLDTKEPSTGAYRAVPV